jgi:hypothetical protein
MPDSPKTEGRVVDRTAYERKQDLVRRAHAEDWNEISRRLTKLGATRLGKRTSGDEGIDLAHEAIKHFFGNVEAWDPERPLLDHLASILNGIAVDRRRKGPNRRRRRDAEEEEAAEVVPLDAAIREPHAPEEEAARPRARREADETEWARPRTAFRALDGPDVDPRDPASEIEAREAARLAVEALERSLADAPLALGVLRLTLSGVTDPEEQARALGHSLVAVYKARERIRLEREDLSQREGSD